VGRVKVKVAGRAPATVVEVQEAVVAVVAVVEASTAAVALAAAEMMAREAAAVQARVAARVGAVESVEASGGHLGSPRAPRHVLVPNHSSGPACAPWAG